MSQLLPLSGLDLTLPIYGGIDIDITSGSISPANLSISNLSGQATTTAGIYTVKNMDITFKKKYIEIQGTVIAPGKDPIAMDITVSYDQIRGLTDDLIEYVFSHPKLLNQGISYLRSFLSDPQVQAYIQRYAYDFIAYLKKEPELMNIVQQLAPQIGRYLQSLPLNPSHQDIKNILAYLFNAVQVNNSSVGTSRTKQVRFT